MNQHEHASIDLAELSTVTGGWNPIKAVVNKAKQFGHQVVDAAETEIQYVKDHPEWLEQGRRWTL
jgi:hypothetical protein